MIVHQSTDTAMRSYVDIERAIGSGRLVDARAAFTAMVRFNSGDSRAEGLLFTGPLEAFGALAGAARRLVDLDDRGPMPDDLRDAIDELSDGDDLDDGSYAAGGAIMLAQAERRLLALRIHGEEAFWPCA